MLCYMYLYRTRMETSPFTCVPTGVCNTPIYIYTCTCSWYRVVRSICCMYLSSDENEATQLLIDHGAEVNSTNKKGATPLIIAAVKGHYSVLRILASHPQIELHVQVSVHVIVDEPAYYTDRTDDFSRTVAQKVSSGDVGECFCHLVGLISPCPPLELHYSKVYKITYVYTSKLLSGLGRGHGSPLCCASTEE